MLAGETSQPFDHEEWVFEIKWDGFRAITTKSGNNINMFSRNGLSFNEKYPVIIQEMENLKQNVILDGEIVVLDEAGKPNFQLLQDYANQKDKPIQYQVFDILNLDGKDTMHLPLLQRKELLKNLLPENPVIRYCDHITGAGTAFFELTKKQGLEGMIAKEIHSVYQPGKRTGNWLKVKHNKTMEAVIAGFTEPTGSRKYFGALILGVQNEEFKYIGHTGTGFTDKMIKTVYDKLKPLIQGKSPFKEKVKTNTPVTWVKPQLVCEVKYSEITKDEKLRHPVFLHLRDEKTPAETTRKEIVAPETPEKKIKKTDREFNIGRNRVVITNYDKVFFPAQGITKGDVAEYYLSIAEYILPYLKGRPQSLLRNPNGILGKSFFHKDAGDNVPAFVETTRIYSESSNRDIDYILCNNAETLLYLINLGCIELNPWHSSVGNLEAPDYLMIDIDPSENNNFEQVIETALTVKEVLEKAGAKSYCKTSGATGLHIYVPTARKYSFDQVKDFAWIVCMMVNERLGSFTTLERNLKKRGKDHIYLDYLQNRRGQTIASVYSVRPKAGATVSTPLLWDEVKPGLTPSQFTIYNMKQRIEKTGDVFKPVLEKGIDLIKCISNLEKL